MATHDFRGFAGDCTIMGQIELADGRLTDALNQANEVVVRGAVLTSLVDDRALHFEELPVRRDELLLVGSDAPAGVEQRRLRTVRELLRVEAGPYIVFGDVHALPGVGGLRAFHSRRGFVPLTSCRVAFARGEHLEVARTHFLLVNTDFVHLADPTTPEQCLEELEARAAHLSELAERSARSDRRDPLIDGAGAVA
jgi:hypothetical protein